MIKNSKGFTLIELVTIIMLLAVVGIIVAPKFSNDGFKESADVTNFLVNVKFARGKSMVEGGGWSFKINSTNRNYEIFDNDGNHVELPSRGKNPVNVTQSIIYIAQDTLVNNRLYFNSLGQPTLNDNGSILAKHKIIININGKKIFIDPFSGGIYE